ncbi:hypothetical protein SFC70_19815 [Bacillus subtilis]
MTSQKPSENSIPFQPSKGKKKTPSILLEGDRKKIEESLKQNIVFSWKYFDKDHKVYNCGGIEMPWMISFLETLKNISGLTIQDLRKEEGKRKGLRFHPIRWGKVTQQKFNFNDQFFEQIRDNCYQLSLSTGKGRFHGFLIENSFFVVWLDPFHQLELMKDHGGVQEFEYPINDYELLKFEYEELKKENNILKELFEKA